eukprot:Skav225791  [mRNA]  locus=scaffold2147:132872:134457:+ [translate_table: standard]
MAEPSRDYDVLFKIVLIGDANVGKTTLLSRFIGAEFSESYKSTIGAAWVDFKVQTLEIQERVVKLPLGHQFSTASQIWDTGGQERFAPLVRSYFRGGHGVAVVYDVTQRGSFERVPWTRKVMGCWLVVGEESVTTKVIAPTSGLAMVSWLLESWPTRKVVVGGESSTSWS